MNRGEGTETYYDTSGLRLHARGIVLYRTIGGDAPGWHLDLGQESVSLAPTPGLTSVPHDLRWLVTAFTRRADLEPVVRRENAPRPNGGETRVTLTSLRDGKSRHWDERHPTPRAEAIARVLGPRRHRSHRALTGRDLALRYLRTEVAALPFEDCAVRRELPGAVARLHETAQRIRLVLKQCAPLTGGRKLTRTIRAELRWVLSALAPFVDDEAQRVRLRRRLDEVSGDFETGDAGVVLDEYFTARAEENRAEVVDVLDSTRYLNLLHALDVLVVVLEEEPERERPRIARLPAEAAFRSLLATASQAVGRRLGELADAEERDTRSAAAQRALNAVQRYDCLLAVSGRRGPAREWRQLLEAHRAAVLAMWHFDALARAAEEKSLSSSVFGVLRRFEADAADRCATDLAWRWREGTFSSVLNGFEGRLSPSPVANGRGEAAPAPLTV
ncbi:hypothetical protein [Amycolatopsis sp. CA-230715]|uniref:hypothetical protein n=1 Tax=Amycolatopsis sp. CA-230715 TaxID=2745196 RepID=UPI001C00E4A5|nr:hypothetical protein [Amycolatopsis sp. CA-230715]QWF77994.1 hypothetical protein HUW46_01387 [Amycolatopsis sp. CA-230715]